MKAGNYSNKAFFAIILLLAVVLLSVIYFFASVVRQDRQSKKVIQNTKQVVGQLNKLLLKIDTFHQQAADYINSDGQRSSAEIQQTIGNISSALAGIRSGGNNEPGLITTIDSIDNAVHKLLYVFNDTIAVRNKTGETLAGINLSITNIRLSVSGILNHKGDYLLQYRQSIKEKGWLQNRRVFIILAVFLLLSIGLIWQLWHNYTLSQKTVKLKLYNNFLVGNIDEAIISTDMDDRILTWNKGATTIFGWEEQEAIGKKRTALLGDDRDIAEFIKTDLKGERVVF
jgi:PAS domain-containing protein